MTRSLEGKQMNTTTVIIGEHGDKQAMAQAEHKEIICEDVNIPYSPLLSIKQNIHQLSILLDETDKTWLRELVKTTALKGRGWTRPFRKDQPGLLRLWGILTALLTRPAKILVLSPMVGMTAEDREAFKRLLVLCEERGIDFRYTAERLQDVMRLDHPQRVRFAAGSDWLDTDTAALSVELEAATPGTTWDDLQRRWEDGANGQKS